MVLLNFTFIRWSIFLMVLELGRLIFPVRFSLNGSCRHYLQYHHHYGCMKNPKTKCNVRGNDRVCLALDRRKLELLIFYLKTWRSMCLSHVCNILKLPLNCTLHLHCHLRHFHWVLEGMHKSCWTSQCHSIRMKSIARSMFWQLMSGRHMKQDPKMVFEQMKSCTLMRYTPKLKSLWPLGSNSNRPYVSLERGFNFFHGSWKILKPATQRYEGVK